MDFYDILFAKKLSGGGSSTAIEELNVTDNGTYTAPTGKAYSPVNVNVGGGGSSGISLLNTITVSENVRGVNVDFSAYTDEYDFIYIYENLELTSKDYMYYVLGGSTPSGGDYGNSSKNHIGVFCEVINVPSKVKYVGTLVSGNSGIQIKFVLGDSNKNIYIYTYSSATSIMSGSVFKIYGGKYEDL